ncbi:hypothetical protein ACFVU2_20990 [Leifsonia sp. NPDC058194]|uniref:hypothetical protein n=1 Tax=Leifsonia sp. NPDC058194 TaxID=3346374 RepID=UPI0036DE0029
MESKPGINLMRALGYDDDAPETKRARAWAKIDDALERMRDATHTKAESETGASDD